MGEGWEDGMERVWKVGIQGGWGKEGGKGGEVLEDGEGGGFVGDMRERREFEGGRMGLDSKG